jgi:hypothetical protein
MKRTSALLISIAIAIAAVFGAVAAVRTTSLGAAAQRTPAATIVARSRALDRFELGLRRELRRTPPPLPPAATPSSQPRVVYRRPAPVLVIKHHQQGDDEFETERDD